MLECIGIKKKIKRPELSSTASQSVVQMYDDLTNRSQYSDNNNSISALLRHEQNNNEKEENVVNITTTKVLQKIQHAAFRLIDTTKVNLKINITHTMPLSNKHGDMTCFRKTP